MLVGHGTGTLSIAYSLRYSALLLPWRGESDSLNDSGPARTIVDCFRYRGKVGLDVALEGLREGLRQRKVTTDQLWRYATKMRVWSILKPYVEATAADAT